MCFKDKATLTAATAAINGAEFGPRANGKQAEVQAAHTQGGKKGRSKKFEAALRQGESEEGTP